MRRVLLLVLCGAVVAVVAGLAVPKSAFQVNDDKVSQSDLNDALTAIHASAPWQCSKQALATVNHLVVPSSVAGVSSPSWSTVTAVQWSDDRVTDLALVPYVQAHDPTALSAASLASAKTSLEGSITSTIQQAYSTSSAQSQFTCTDPQSGQKTLASMPAWFQDQEIEGEAAALALPALAGTSIPESGPGLESWFNQHRAQFDTLCVSFIAVADPTTASQVASAISSGTLSFAAAAKHYSQDPSTAKKGGAFGCVPPTSQYYAFFDQYVGTLPTGSVSSVVTVPEQGGYYYFLFTVTKRTANDFAAVSAVVADAAKRANGAAAAVLAAKVQRSANVRVSSPLGTWAETVLGGSIVPPVPPPVGAVTNATANAP